MLGAIIGDIAGNVYEFSLRRVDMEEVGLIARNEIREGLIHPCERYTSPR
jgi:hypothetical protein